MQNQLVTFAAKVEFETEKAYLLRYSGRKMWLPKSQIREKVDLKGKTCEFRIPAWLAVEKEIMEPEKEVVHSSAADEPPVADDDIPF